MVDRRASTNLWPICAAVLASVLVPTVPMTGLDTSQANAQDAAFPPGYCENNAFVTTSQNDGSLIAGLCGYQVLGRPPVAAPAVWLCTSVSKVGLTPVDLARCTDWRWTGTGTPSTSPPAPPVRRLAAGTVTSVQSPAPSGATAVLANLTMVEGVSEGYITADRCSSVATGTQTKSSGNHAITTAVANLTVVAVDPDGRFCLFNQRPVNLVADVQGYFGPTGSAGTVFTPTTPTRVLDTRGRLPGTLASADTGAPEGAAAVVINLTMVNGSRSGWVSADNCTAAGFGPRTSSGNSRADGTAVSNLVVVPLDASRRVCVLSQTPIDVVIDVLGWFGSPDSGGLRFEPTVPARLLDTREHQLVKPEPGTITRVVTGATTGTEAVLVNMAMVDGAAPGYVTAGKCTELLAGPQVVSSGNHDVRIASSNLAAVSIDSDGSFCIFNQQSVHLVVDLQGTFGRGASQLFFPTGSTRAIDTRTI